MRNFRSKRIRSAIGLEPTTSTDGMATQYVPGDIRDFILKHIASVAQIEALLLIWSNPEKRWSVSKVAARIYAGETETAKALEGLCANGLLVCKDDVFWLERIGRKRRNDWKAEGSIRSPSHPGDGCHPRQIARPSPDGRDARASKGSMKCARASRARAADAPQAL